MLASATRLLLYSIAIFDIEKTAGGCRLTVTEFGRVKDPEQFKALYAYSPYHHVCRRGHRPELSKITLSIPRLTLTRAVIDRAYRPQSSFVASAAPSERAFSFAQAICG